MSGAAAVRGATQTLLNVLRRQLPGVPVRSAPPDLPPDTETPGKRLNLFLYRVLPNPELSNQEIPGNGHPAAYGHPPLSLDLHYLLTAYPDVPEDELSAHELLGRAMRVLHEHPLIDARDPAYRDGASPLLDGALRDAFEQLKAVLEPLSIEDLSKVWTSFSSPYRLSVGYKVTVVQIESTRPRRYPRPVGEPPAGPKVQAVPLRRPRIESLRVRRPEDPEGVVRDAPYVRIGDTLLLQGSHLDAPGFRILVGAADLDAQPSPDEAGTLHAEVADRPELQPGAHAVEVEIPLGLSPALSVRSAGVPLMLVPRVDGIGLASGSTLEDGLHVAHGSTDMVRVRGARLHRPGAACMAVVGAQVVPASAFTAAAPDEIRFALPDLEPGTHVVRVRVAGAESFDAVQVVVD